MGKSSTRKKLDQIKEILELDLLAADVKLSIFISAAKSFKQDSLLSPFPKSYIDNNVKNFKALVNRFFLSEALFQ